MEEIKHPKGKIYYTMGEVSEMFDVRPSLLRYWEQEFDILKPHRNKKGNRLFTPQDVDNVRIIYHLLKEKKMKIEVARKHVREHRKEADRDAEIVERLMSIRAMLEQIKQDMLHGASEDDYDDRRDGDEAPMVNIKKAGAGGNVRTPGTVRSGADTKPSPAADAPTGESETFSFAVQTGVRPDARAAVAEKTGRPVADSGVLTVSDVIRDEEENGEKPPFKEQMLFEIVSGQEELNVDAMISTFIAKNYDEEADGEKPVVDPFAGLDENEAGKPHREDDAPRPTVIEQTLF